MEVENMEVDDVPEEVPEPCGTEDYQRQAATSETLSHIPYSVSTSSTDSIVSCRICKSGGGSDLVPSPCHCKGSMGTVHISCLEEWLTGSTRDSCELCSVPFHVVRTRKFSCGESLWFYLRHHISPFRLLRDTFFLFVSLMNTSILLYMWLVYIFKDVLSFLGTAPGTKQTALDYVMFDNPVKGVLYFFFFTLCLVFVSVNAVDDFRRIFYFYFLPWYNWWKNEVDVKLVIQRNDGDKPKDQ